MFCQFVLLGLALTKSVCSFAFTSWAAASSADFSCYSALSAHTCVAGNENVSHLTFKRSSFVLLQPSAERQVTNWTKWFYSLTQTSRLSKFGLNDLLFCTLQARGEELWLRNEQLQKMDIVNLIVPHMNISLQEILKSTKKKVFGLHLRGGSDKASNPLIRD